MKCEFCGQSLSLEEEVCSHCGQVNPHAQQHIQDMKRYKGEFESTKEGVYAVTGKYTQITTRIIVIAVLVVLIVILYFVTDNVYGFHSDYQHSKAKRNVKKYTAIMDEYMENEDFRRLSMFCDENRIGSYVEGYEVYAPVISAARYYDVFCDSLMKLTTDVVPEGESPNWRYTADYLNSFYAMCDLSKYDYLGDVKTPENMAALETMENNVELMLQTYLGFTEEETAGLKEMSEAKRTVLFEEKFDE